MAQKKGLDKTIPHFWYLGWKKKTLLYHGMLESGGGLMVFF
jgi:hypothetical protein